MGSRSRLHKYTRVGAQRYRLAHLSKKTVDRLCELLDALPGVVQCKSRFGSRQKAWSIQGREFAHLHSDRVLDLRLPREMQQALRGDRRARFRKGRSEWVELEFRSQADAAEIAALAAGAARAVAAK